MNFLSQYNDDDEQSVPEDQRDRFDEEFFDRSGDENDDDDGDGNKENEEANSNKAGSKPIVDLTGADEKKNRRVVDPFDRRRLQI